MVSLSWQVCILVSDALSNAPLPDGCARALLHRGTGFATLRLAFAAQPEWCCRHPGEAVPAIEREPMPNAKDTDIPPLDPMSSCPTPETGAYRFAAKPSWPKRVTLTTI
jgi:hypothetical protein